MKTLDPRKGDKHGAKSLYGTAMPALQEANTLDPRTSVGIVLYMMTIILARKLGRAAKRKEMRV